MPDAAPSVRRRGVAGPGFPGLRMFPIDVTPTPAADAVVSSFTAGISIMKCIRLKDEQIDVCVTVDVKAILMKKSSGEITEELERQEVARLLQHLGSTHEGPLARQIALEFRARSQEPKQG